MKIASWNVNGIRASAKKGFIEWLEKSGFDIVGIQETKASLDQLDAEITEVNGYPSFLINSAQRKGYSGVANYHREGFAELKETKGFDINVFNENNLPPKISSVEIGKKESTIGFEGYEEIIGPEEIENILDSNNFDKLSMQELAQCIEDFNSEGRVLQTEIKLASGEELILFNIYFPNGGQGAERILFKLQFYEVLVVYLQELLKKNKNIIVGGDYNTAHHAIDLARPKQNTNTTGFMPIERVYMDKVLNLGFSDSFRQINKDKPDMYTWWSYRAGARERNIGWRIDYFYISDALKPKLKDAQIHTDVMGSDHCPISVELAL